MLHSCEEGSTSKVPPPRSRPYMHIMKGLLVGIRVLNKAPHFLGCHGKGALRARKLTWNPQHGELSLWRRCCLFFVLGKTHGKTIIWSTIWGEEVYTFWSKSKWAVKKLFFFAIVQGLFQPLVLLGLRYPTIFGESDVSKASGFVFFVPSQNVGHVDANA